MSKIQGTIVRHGYRVNISDMTPEQVKQIKKDLSIKPFNAGFDNNTDENTIYKLYKEKKEKLIIPRYYGIKMFGDAPIVMKIKNTDIKFNGTLRPYQQTIADTCVKQIKETGGGLLSLFCGGGKTVMALNLACTLKVKTLVLVHKSFLQDQWIERAKEFTNARIGIIRQKVADVEDKDIVIGMVQSISKRNYDPNVFKGFGLTIYDEAHHFSSRVFSKALVKTGAKYTLALSATPYRGDGLIKVLHWYVGDTIYQQRYKINNQVCTKIFYFSSNDKLFVEKKRLYKRKLVSDPLRMIGNFTKIKDRNQHIANIINTIRKDPDRKIIVLSHRVKHLEVLKKMVDDSIAIDVETGKILKNEINTYFFIGKLKKKERDEAQAKGDILFATYEMAKEALDVERLNTVVLATPLKDVKQSVGRIMRKVLKNGDMRPLIIDFTDDIECIKNHGDIRQKFYNKVHYNLEYYYLYNDELLNSSKYLEKFNIVANEINEKDEKKEKDDKDEEDDTELDMDTIMKVTDVEILDEIDDPVSSSSDDEDDNVFSTRLV